MEVGQKTVKAFLRELEGKMVRLRCDNEAVAAMLSSAFLRSAEHSSLAAAASGTAQVIRALTVWMQRAALQHVGSNGPRQGQTTEPSACCWAAFIAIGTPETSASLWADDVFFSVSEIAEVLWKEKGRGHKLLKGRLGVSTTGVAGQGVPATQGAVLRVALPLLLGFSSRSLKSCHRAGNN
ncbi:hypothetical protein CYMTET_36110 [Cymbomonas tetramitiformis]|uniref:Uncharacterized protein n=1 Tax=Cymbomonas tetramitiformis TaxID=36881 RepID=A0AAE0CGL6_9CHLO|nr:hypothetical protein CYMTET_36110 [Cymbomonas tetramitiformis]